MVTKGVCKCEYNVEREIVIVKEKFVLLSKKKWNDDYIKEKKTKKKCEKKIITIRLGVQRINIKQVWGNVWPLGTNFGHERM